MTVDEFLPETEDRYQTAEDDPAAFTRRLVQRIHAARTGTVSLVRETPRRASRDAHRPDGAGPPRNGLLRDVRGLCDRVLRSDDIDLLAAFVIDFDGAGARTFACLLYTLNRLEGALFWWRFAAGTGDELAAHFLAMYHAAVGPSPDARVWRMFARFLGFTPARHLPRPVREEGDLAAGFASLVRESTMVDFMNSDSLPKELIAS